MGTFVLSTLILQSLGVIVSALALALSSCLPARRAAPGWASTDTALRPVDLQTAVIGLADEAELPHAA